MAVQTTEEFKNGGATSYAITIEYLKASDIKVRIGGALQTYVASSPSSGEYTVSGTTVTLGAQAAAGSGNVHIYRETDVDTAAAVFAAGSSIRAADLNAIHDMARFGLSEARSTTIESDIKDGAVTSAKILDGTIVNADINASAAIAGTKVNPVFGSQNMSITGNITVSGTVDGRDVSTDGSKLDGIETGATADQTAAEIRTLIGNASDSNVLTDTLVSKLNAIEAGATTDQTAAEIRTLVESASDSNVFTDADHSKLNAIDNNATDDQTASEIKTLIASSPLDASHLAANSVTTSEIADNSVNSEHYVDGSIDTQHIADSQITTAKIVNNAVTTDKINDNAVTAAKIVAGAVGNGELATSAVVTSKLGPDAVTGAKIADDSINSEHYVDGSIDTAHIGNTQVTDAKLASNAVTTSKITDANVTTAKVADSNITLAKLASDLKQTTVSNSDTQLPTSGAVVDYVAAQIAPIGGLEVIANDASFPNTQPQAGVVISIADAGGLVVNGSGTSTTARTLGGSTVTINNINSTYNSSTITDGVGFLVSSTGSGQIYNFHKSVIRDQDISSISTDINDFANRYRVASSAPTSSKDDGDLWFDTANGKMMVYNANNTAWEEVSAIGNFNINTISSSGNTGGGSATFNGSAYRFVLSNPPQDAQQLLVSINGVIQKPNTGTSQPSEGFAISGNDIIFSAAPASGSSSFIITLGQSVQIGTPSDGTVSTSKLASGAVTTAKIADDAITTAKIAASAVGNTEIANNAISTAKINGGAVNSGALGTGVVTTAKIADDAVTGAKIATNLDLPDNNKIRFGTGNDLEIFHDGSNSWIKDAGTGNLNVASSAFAIKNAAANENMLATAENGNVELFYDNSKKAETDAFGLEVFGELRVTDSSYGNTHFNYLATGNNYINQGDSSITQFRNASGTVRTQIEGSGNWTWKDNIKVQVGDGQDLKIYHDGSDSYIDETGTGSLLIRTTNSSTVMIRNSGENMARFLSNGAVELYYDNSKKLETTSTGVSITGNAKFADNGTIQLGDGNDLSISHNGTDSQISSATGSLRIRSDAFKVMNANNNEALIYANADGAVELYHNNSRKVQTNNNGLEVHGKLVLGNDDIPSGQISNYSLDVQGDGTNAYIDLGNPFPTFSAGQFPVARLKTVDSNKSLEIHSMWGGDNALYKHIELAGDKTQFFRGTSTNVEIARFATHGLTFNGDTAADNSLDDYEEGTFTSQLNSGSFSANQGSNRYVKVGNIVHVSGRLADFSSSTSSTDIGVSLPFTCKNVDSVWVGNSVWNSPGSSLMNNTVAPRALQNTSTMQFLVQGNSGGGNWVWLEYSHLHNTTNTACFYHITYQTA